MSAAHVHFLMQMRDQIKVYHWQTKSFSRHKATDEVVGKLDENIDQFVEVYMGKYGRFKLGAATNTIKLVNMSEATALKFIRGCEASLRRQIREKLDERRDSELANICDEILADLNQLLYLFSLK